MRGDHVSFGHRRRLLTTGGKAHVHLFINLASIDKALLWFELCPPKRDTEFQTPNTCKCALFGNRVFADGIKLK